MGKRKMLSTSSPFDDYEVGEFRQLGQQLLTESPLVLSQLSGPLSNLKANIDAVKRRSGFDAIKENYNGELDKLSSETSDSRCSLSSDSQQDVSDADEIKMIEFQRTRPRSMSTPGPLYGTKFNTQRYKSEICQRFMENGSCKYGEKCQFAHGEDELRYVYKHPKYKTLPCKTFHQSGVCSYGNRCNFLHAETEDDLVKQRIKQQSQRRMSVPNVRLMTSSLASMSLDTIQASQNEQRLPTFRRL